MRKKVMSLFLISAMTAGLVAGCGNTNESGSAKEETKEKAESTTKSDDEITCPESLTIMVDGTLAATEINGQKEFIDKLEELTGIKEIKIIQPDHSAYYDVLGQQMASAEVPDVVLLSAPYLASYASAGVLWDMTDAYEGSDLQARQEAANSTVYVDSVRIDGRLFGMPAMRGGGCVTYVRQAWLDECNLSVPTTYEEYMNMLREFKKAGIGETADYVTGASGFIGTEAPYINYWPEFYQDAYPTFIQQEDGTWIDGFAQDSMKDAMQRLSDAVKEGLIDVQSLDQSTKDARTKFMANEYGAFSYWANNWATNLKSGLEVNNYDSNLIAIKPIEEVGTYINRLSTSWAITEACDNPEGVYKYFVETMQDGADCQFLWTYGVDGVHYSYDAETLFEGTDAEVSYEDGTFHWLPTGDDPSKQYSSIHIKAVDALVQLADDPNAMEEEAKQASEMFAENCRNEAMIPATDEYMSNNGDLTTLKNQLIARVATGQISVDDAYKTFESDPSGKALSEAIVASLNELN